MSQSTLTELGIKYGTDKVSHRFTETYDMIFNPIRKTVHRVMEVGVFFGSSILMWRDYFDEALIIGIDHFSGLQGNGSKFENPTKFFDYQLTNPDKRIELHRVNQAVDAELIEFAKNQVHGVTDIIIDDASHLMKDQQLTFLRLFSLLRPGGYFVMEDLHTSLMNDYDVLPDRSNSTLQMFENFKKTQKLNSVYFSDTFEGQIESVDIYYSNNGTSITGIIKKAFVLPHPVILITQPKLDVAVFVNFADPRYRSSQLKNAKHAADCNIPYIVSFTEHNIEKMTPANYNSRSQTRGYGYWDWKPYVIYATMMSTNASTIIYCDSGSRFSLSYTDALRMGQQYDVTASKRSCYPEREWTKGDIYEHFGMSTENDTSIQLLAQWMIFRNNDETRALVHEWMLLSQNVQLISDKASKTANHPTFRENRHDQSLLSMLVKVRPVTSYFFDYDKIIGDHGAFK